MTLDSVRQVADAVLYEGYLLYPYRASAQKNRSRWQFGVLVPPAFAAADPSESASAQAECVFEHTRHPSAEVTVRFLQVQRRRAESSSGDVEVWDEAVERETTVTVPSPALLGEETVTRFSVPGGEDVSEQADGETASGTRVIRRREALTGAVSVRAVPLPGPWGAARLTVRVTNETGGTPGTRDEALPGSLVAAHMIITLSSGAFLSMTDPPEWAALAVGECESRGCWPVLAGPRGDRSTMLAAPIILPEYPEVAAESPGELFDGTEIDEILTLRTLALSDEEKAAARATDARAAALIDRVEAMDAPTMEQLHGTIRAMSALRPADVSAGGVPGFPAGGVPGVPGIPGMSGGVPGFPGSVPGAGDVPWWDPGADASVSPETDSVVVAGQRVARGSRVILRPGTPSGAGGAGRRADAQDMFLAGREALVEAVLQDVDGGAYLAVSLTDDPGADLSVAHGRFLYFAPDEVEPQ